MTEVMAATAVQNSTAINVHVFRNGDPFFPPKKCVVNPRKVNFDSFLNEVTRLVRLSGGAARNLYTPTRGHRIREVADLVNNSYYVAGGSEKFKKDQYTAGGVRMIRPRHRQTKNIRPVAHARIQVSAKCRKVQEGPKIVHVFRNRDDKSPSIKLLLDKRHRGNMDLVYDYVNQKVNLISGQAVQRLYHLNGGQVLDESEIESGGQYVAAAREKFAKVGYGNTEVASPRGKAGFMFGRVPSNTRYGLRPIVQLPKVKTATKISPRVPQAKKHPVKPTPKPPAKRPPAQRRKLAEKTSTPKKEVEGMFPMKPTMVKKSREKEEKSPLDYSDDPNSVFKAKEKRDEERGANEVQDTNDTVTELPIDQVAAEEVEEEDNLNEDIEQDEEEKVVDKAPSKSPEVEEEVEEDVPEEVEAEEQEEIPETNQNNNHLENHHQESLPEINDPPPVIEEEIKPSSPPATPGPQSPVPSPPQNRPESRESPAFMTDKVKSPEPEQILDESPEPQQELHQSPEPEQELHQSPEPEQELHKSPEPEQEDSGKPSSPDFDLPKSPSPISSDSPSPKAASPKPQTPQQENSPSPPLQPKPTSPEEIQKAKSPISLESPSPKNSIPDARPPSERGSASSSQRSMSAPAGNAQDTNGEIANSNSTEKKKDDQIAEIPENIEDENDELINQESSDILVSDDANKSPSPENNVRTPSPPKSPRKTPSRTRSQTPPRQSPAPNKEQIGNGHSHPEEVNA